MAMPEGIATVAVTGRYIRPDGTPLTGTVSFTPPARLTFPNADTISAGAATVALDEEGAFFVSLIATDVPGMQPEDWTYTVTEKMGRAEARTYAIVLPSATPAVDLADIAPANPSDGEYVLVTGPAGKAGSQILSGMGAPIAGEGADGDFYVDKTAGAVTLYGPKAAGAWPATGVVLGSGNLVASVNTKTGAVVLSASDVGAIARSGTTTGVTATITGNGSADPLTVNGGPTTSDRFVVRADGSVYSNSLLNTFYNLGIGPGSTPFGGGRYVLGMQNATTIPSGTPGSGGILYVDGGALKYRGSSGTVTTIAPA